MSVFITLLAALFVFSAVIAIHEFGHFAVAKLCGIRVNEFSIGMGPALWKTVRKGTQYTLRALPVGGYVALEGDWNCKHPETRDRLPRKEACLFFIPISSQSRWCRLQKRLLTAYMATHRPTASTR